MRFNSVSCCCITNFRGCLAAHRSFHPVHVVCFIQNAKSVTCPFYRSVHCAVGISQFSIENILTEFELRTESGCAFILRSKQKNSILPYSNFNSMCRRASPAIPLSPCYFNPDSILTIVWVENCLCKSKTKNIDVFEL